LFLSIKVFDIKGSDQHPKRRIKNRIASDYFAEFDTTKIIGNVDFCATLKQLNQTQSLMENIESKSFLWAEPN
jgi:hypothetical protein